MKFSGPELIWMLSIVLGGAMTLSAGYLDIRRLAWSEQTPCARRVHLAGSVLVLIVWIAFIAVFIGSLVKKGV